MTDREAITRTRFQKSGQIYLSTVRFKPNRTCISNKCQQIHGISDD